MVTEQQVRTALEDVHDAHVPVSLRGMGMLSRVQVDAGRVEVEVSIPCMACPATSYLAEQVRERVLAVTGVHSVEITMGPHLFWDRDDVDPAARALMRAHGIQL